VGRGFGYELRGAEGRELPGWLPPTPSCRARAWVAHWVKRGGDEHFGRAAGIAEHGVVVTRGGERVRAFVEDGKLSTEASRVRCAGFSRGGDDALLEPFLVVLDQSRHTAQVSSGFDRGVVEGAAAQDAAVGVERFEDRHQPFGRGKIVTFELHLGRDRRLLLVSAQVGFDKRVLRCEVLVEGARRYVRLLRQRRDPGRVNPLLIEQLIRGPQDPLARAATAARGIAVSGRLRLHTIEYSERFTSRTTAATVDRSKAFTVPMKEGQMSERDTLGYDVFVSDPFPMNVPGRIPDGEPHLFSPLATTLIYGEHDAVLAEAPLTTDQAAAVGDWVEASGKNLTHIYASHAHGDHWFTADALADRFGAQVVASAGTVGLMPVQVAARTDFWDKLWPGQIPPSPVTATTPAGNRFTLDGHELVIVEVGHADTDGHSVLHVPDVGLVVAGDAIYNGVHQYLGESADGGRDAWRKATDIVAGLQPRWVVASHKNKELDDDAPRVIGQTRQYLDDADELLKQNDTPVDFFNAMRNRWPDRRLGGTILWVSASALYANSGDVIQDLLTGWFATT
jgi:glyoxylase-like metal-dependent hydrolase (beta-lactamase superfamily II)